MRGLADEVLLPFLFQRPPYVAEQCRQWFATLSQSDRLMDAAFHRMLILLGVAFAGVILSLVVAKLLFGGGNKSGPPAREPVK